MAGPSEELIIFCQTQHPRLVGMLALYCGNRDVAEELAQETLAIVCRDWTKVQKADSPVAWAHRVGINLAHSHFRRRAAERRATERLQAQKAVNDAPWPTERTDLIDAVTRLPHRQRSALLLRYYLGLRVHEVADALHCPEGTAKTLIHRGLRALGRDIQDVESQEATDVI